MILRMKTRLIVILALMVVVVFLLLGTDAPKKITLANKTLALPNFSLTSLKLPFFNNNAPSSAEWNTFEKYLAFAQSRDLEGLKSLSHQISPSCSDPSQREQCNKLMDSVSNLKNIFIESDFKNSVSDSKQTILYTDGPNRAFLYFTKTESGEIKVLGMRLCIDNGPDDLTCVDKNATQTDSDLDGWWNSTEALFYK